MIITTLTSDEFIRDAGEAKRAANKGPVFTTGQGKRSHVLLSFDDYRRLTGQRRNIADALAMPEPIDVDFDPPPVLIRPRCGIEI